ncbi:MAG: ABC transporter permease [Anaerolineae bacterium]|nr:ABC transporter permease [Anaerolineae bacterium]
MQCFVLAPSLPQLRELAMGFVRFLLSRILIYILVIWVGITTIFFIPRLMPSDPVEAMLGRVMSQGAFMEPEQVQALRQSLIASFGLEGTLGQQYVGFLKRVLLTGDFGPSLAMFPTPVMDLIRKAIPWSLFLLLSSAIIAWVIGNVIGLLSGYYRHKVYSRILEAIAVTIYPIPYYILALILIILFVYIKPIFPLSFSVQGKFPSLQFIVSTVYNSILPALSIVIAGSGWWVLSMKALSSSISEEDFVRFAKLKGVGEGKIMGQYVLRNAILPQITMLALVLGGVFNGALITEILFAYPGLGTLIYTAVLQADYNLLMGTISLSIIAVATATFLVDLLYPFFDPRIRYR